MKTTNYLYLEYQRTLRLFHKLQARFEKRVANGSIGELTARKRYRLLKKLEKLKGKLSSLISRMKLAGLAGAMGLTGFALESGAQSLPEKANVLNRITLNETFTGDQLVPDITMNDEGKVVTVWQDGNSIKGRYLDDPDSFSSEFTIFQEDVSNNCALPSVAMDSSGDFVVTWLHDYQGDYYVAGQKFDGETLTGQGVFVIEDIPNESEVFDSAPSVGMAEDGDLFVAYETKYASQEVARIAYRANDGTTTYNYLNIDLDKRGANPSISMDIDGNIVAVWDEDYYDSSYFMDFSSIHFQRFAADDVTGIDSPEVLVSGEANDGNGINLRYASTALNDNGEFAVTWLSATSMYNNGSIVVQKFGSDNSAIGSENIALAEAHNVWDNPHPDVAIENTGNFSASFKEYDSSYGVQSLYVNRYHSEGTLGDQITVYTENSTFFELRSASIASNHVGDFAVVWHDNYESELGTSGDQSGFATYLSMYGEKSLPIISAYQWPVNQDNMDNCHDAAISSNDDGDYVIAWVREYTPDGTYFAVRARRFHADGKPNGDEFLLHYNSNYDIYSIDVDLNSDGEFVLGWIDEEGVYKKVFDAEDNSGDPDTLRQNFITQPISVAIDETGDFSVVAWREGGDYDYIMINTGNNETYTRTINSYNSDAGNPDVSIGIDQNFTVVWEDEADPLDPGNSTTFYSSIYQMRFSGETQLDAQQVLVTSVHGTVYGFENPEVSASHESGDYAIAFSDKYGVRASVFDSEGAVIVSEFGVDESNDLNNNNLVQVDMNREGEFVVAWEGEDNYGDSGSLIRKFSDTGEEITPEVLAMGTTTQLSGVAIADDKSITVGYYSAAPVRSIVNDPANYEIVGPYEQLVNTHTTSFQDSPDIASNSNGDYVIVWDDDDDDYIKARQYNSSGEALSDEILINAKNGGENYSDPHVVLRDDGDFMVTWEEYNGAEYVIMAQIMDWDRNVLVDDFQVSRDDLGTDPYMHDTELDEVGDFTVAQVFRVSGNSEIHLTKFSNTGSVTFPATKMLDDSDLPASDHRMNEIAMDINNDGDVLLGFDAKYLYDYLENTDVHIIRIRSIENLSEPGVYNEFDLDFYNPCGDCDQIEKTIDIISDDTGDFIISNSIIDYYDRQTFLRKYTPGDASVGDPVCIGYGEDASMVISDNGDIEVVYERYDFADSKRDILKVRVDSDFQMIGHEFKLNALNTNSENPVVTMTSPGVFVSAWESDLTDGSNIGIVQQEFYSIKPILSDDIPDLPALLEAASENFGIQEQYIVNNSTLEPVTISFTVLPQFGTLVHDLGEEVDVTLGTPLSLEEAGALVYEHDGTENFTDALSFTLGNGLFESQEYSFDITIVPVNDDTELTSNNGMTVDEGGNSSLYEALATNDPDNTDDEIEFTITSLPSHGTLWNVEDTEFELGLNDTFTQTDVGFAYVEYRHNGDEEATDSFEFTFGDLEFTSTIQTFDIDVNPINDDPILGINTGISVDEGIETQISNTHIETTDVDNNDTEIVYSLTTIPAYGIINLAGVPLGLTDTFTQSDIDNGDLTYTQDGSEDSTSDSFDFDVSDGAGGNLSGFTFDIDITFTNDDPVLDNPIADQSATEDVFFDFALPSDVFSDEETSTLALTVTQSDDSPLPAWLSFDADGYTFSGTPTEGDGDVTVKVTGEDEGGSTISDEFTISVESVNDVPIVAMALEDQSATEDEAFSFTVPAGTFSDEETTALTLTATQSDDSALPAWLSFDGSTFSGTPLEGDGNVTITVTAEDEEGATVEDEFTITVTPVNDAPMLVTGLEDQSATEDEAFIFTVPAGTFSDEETTALTLTATQSDDSPLPSWLSFDGSTFSGTPLEGDGDVTITVAAEDEGGSTVEDEFTITVAFVNDNPIMVTNNELQASEVQPHLITNMHLEAYDPDNSRVEIIYRIITEPTEGWLFYDDIENTYTTFTQEMIDSGLVYYGTLGQNNLDTDSFTFTVEDQSGESSEIQTFSISISLSNDEPILVTALEDQSATEGEAFSFAIPAGTFSDEESSSLALTATQSDDSPLPAWLNFDGSVFSGTPGDGDGDVTIKVTAEDEGGLTVSDEFMITVSPINNTAPTVDQGIADQTIDGYEPFSFTVPSDAFTDAEDALILSATDVPSFVSFDSGTGTFSGQARVNEDEGVYTITVTATEDNEEERSVSTTFDLEIVGILGQEELRSEISVYPNPAMNLLITRLISDETGEFEMQLFDRSGRMVASDSFVKNSGDFNYEMDISSLTPGLYVLRIIRRDSVSIFKVSKK